MGWWLYKNTWQDLLRGLSNDMGSNEQGIPEDKVLNCMIGKVLVVGPKVLLLYSFKTDRILVVREGESEGECVGGTLLLFHFLLFKHFCQFLIFIIVFWDILHVLQYNKMSNCFYFQPLMLFWHVVTVSCLLTLTAKEIFVEKKKTPAWIWSFL